MEEPVDVLLATPVDRRRNGDVRVLRKAVGYVISVVPVADPAAGLPLIDRLAALASSDADAAWVVGENPNKARLKPWAERPCRRAH